jgi:hypothetical protein
VLSLAEATLGRKKGGEAMQGMMPKIETGNSKHKEGRKLDTEGEEGLE